MRRFWQYPALAVVLALTGLCVWMGPTCPAGCPAVSAPVPAPPQTQSGATTQPVGTGKIAGQVVALDNGAPVKRVTITVMGGTTQTASFRGASSGTRAVLLRRRTAAGPPAACHSASYRSKRRLTPPAASNSRDCPRAGSA